MASIDSREFTEWQAAYRVQPWGDDWAQTDLICWILHAINRPSSSPSLPVNHFLPMSYPVGMRPMPAKMPSPEEVTAKLEAWGRASGLLQTPEGVKIG
jgi:hypothetical protein